MRPERIIMRIIRMIQRGDLQKMAQGKTAAKAPDKNRIMREAMRMARRVGRL